MVALLKTTQIQEPSSASVNISLDSSGNVGIGTASPTGKLDVVATSASSYLNVRSSGIANAVQIVQDTGGTAYFQNTYASGDAIFGTAGNNAIFKTASTERMRIDSSGNVGVGTSSPSYNLEVYSSGALLAGITRATTSTDAGAIFSFSTLNASSAKTSMADIVGASSTTTAGAENGYMSLRTKTSGSMTEKVRIDSSGNVGIGLTSLTEKFEVSGSVNASTASSASFSTGNQRAFMDYVPGSTTARFGHLSGASGSTTGVMAMFTNGTERMRIDSSGNVGIGTSSPSTKFNVIGDIHVGTSGNSARINNSGADIVQFYASRNGSNPYFYYNTSNSYGTTSDARTKNSITDINTSEALSYVMKLKPSSFKMNGDEKYQAGFIAQNCLEASQSEEQKSAVAHYETYDEQDEDCPYLGVSDRPILAHAIAAIKELKSIIDAQATEIAALKAKVGA